MISPCIWKLTRSTFSRHVGLTKYNLWILCKPLRTCIVSPPTLRTYSWSWQRMSFYCPSFADFKGNHKFHAIKKENWTVVAYACAKELNLEEMAAGVEKQGLYHSADVLPDDVDDAVQFSANYKLDVEPREVYIFRNGAAIFWNVPEIERLAILKFLKNYGDGPYDDNLVQDENEILDYSYTTMLTKLRKGKIHLNSEGPVTLEKYTFSNALALSVKLAIWESSLDRFVEGIEPISEDLKRGTPVKLSRDQVLRKMGALFMISHMINLSSNLLDTPDFYWEREELEPLYHEMCRYLSISKRTKVINEKINHCTELLQLLKDHLNDQHHVRLEIMIIILIMIEVVFEFIHWIM